MLFFKTNKGQVVLNFLFSFFCCGGNFRRDDENPSLARR